MKINPKLSKILATKITRKRLVLLYRSLTIISISCFLLLFGAAKSRVYGLDPHCDDCGPMTGTFYECLHRTTTDHCDKTKCIENILNTDSCVLVAGDAPNNCDAKEVWPATYAVRQIGRTMTCKVNTGRETDFVIWKSVGYGCNTDCDWTNYMVRCDTTSCTGPVFEGDSFVGIKYKCGCTPEGGSTNAKGHVKDDYRTNETVYASGNGFPVNTCVCIYIVEDRAWTDGDAIPADVSSDGMNRVQTDESGNLAPVSVWEPPLTVGEYDLVIDVNCDGVYDADTDVVDDPNHPGFIVTPAGGGAPAVGGTAVMANKIKLLAPWITLAALILLSAGIIVIRRSKKHS